MELSCVSAVLAEPLSLEASALDRIAGGGAVPPLDSGQPPSGITTSISMPIAISIAICYQCSGNASTVATANAVSLSQADAFALTMGQGNTVARSNAIGPILMMLPSATMPPAR